MAKSKDMIFVEKTLKNYKAYKAEQNNLNTLLSLIEKEKEEAIAGANLSASIIDDMPHYRVAGTKHFKFDNDELKVLEEKEKLMKSRLKYLDALLIAIDTSLNSLLERDREIVIMFYIKRKSLVEIADHVSLSRVHVFKVKTGLICYVTKSLKVFNYDV